MVCRSCGLGPSPVRKSSASPRSVPVVNRSVPAKPKVENVAAKKKTSIPTRSPARTFPTIGE